MSSALFGAASQRSERGRQAKNWAGPIGACFGSLASTLFKWLCLNGLAEISRLISSIALGAVVIVCSCNVISDAKIRASIQAEAGPRTPGAVYRCLGCSPNCGRCLATVQSLIIEALAEAGDQSDGGCGASCGAMAALP